MKVRDVVAIFLLVLLTSSVVFADGTTINATILESSGTLTASYDDYGNVTFIWDKNCFTGPDCTLIIALEFRGRPNGESWFNLTGEKDDDPVVQQTVKNGSQVTWLDWHVDILNGVIDRNDPPIVYKVNENSPWQIFWITNPGYTDGFGAVWVGGNSAVGPGESLFIRFRWYPDGSGLPITIHQYPTDTGEPIPEPSSLLTTVLGLMSFGFVASRRKRI